LSTADILIEFGWVSICDEHGIVDTVQSPKSGKWGHKTTIEGTEYWCFTKWASAVGGGK
jgi:hypothetical protein